MTNNIFPWQAHQWEALQQSRLNQRLHHALLFQGEAGMGKKQFAYQFAKSVLCSTQTACGNCRSCHLMQVQNHPDFRVIEKEPESSFIKIEQIREAIHFINETAQQSPYRIMLIAEAHAMNINSMNALLKTLEEPPPQTLIILITNLNSRLPATIYSRCEKIIFPKVSYSKAAEWLKSNMPTDLFSEAKLLLNLANGAPLKVIDWIEKNTLEFRREFYETFFQLRLQHTNPLQVANHYQEADLGLLFHLLFSWLTDLLRFKMTEGHAPLVNQDYQAEFAKINPLISLTQLVSYIDYIKKTYAYIVSSFNLNRLLLLEEVFIKWVRK